jgi:glyoxylase-like metal-dependent hydrolase (beta-lactamase superfamily II)/rhodanese-related sulfurtransferase
MTRSFIFASFALISIFVRAEIEVSGNTMVRSITDVININTDELVRALDKDANIILIDVRTESEVLELGAINRGQNVNVPRGRLEFEVNDLSNIEEDTPIIVYSNENKRSTLAAALLDKMGYTNVENYADGYTKWQELGHPVWLSDMATDSVLYRTPVQIYKELVTPATMVDGIKTPRSVERVPVEGLYSAIGATQPATYENSNHNNNLSFIVTSDGVLVFNAGGSYLLARAIHEEIKKVTDQKVKYVVLENAQGHAMLGSSYWKEQGATIVSHVEAYRDIKQKAENKLESAKRRMKDKMIGTSVDSVLPDQTFESEMILTMGETTIELMHLGPSHSPDDIQLWLPDHKVLISGDTAFNERMLPVFEETDTGAWIETWDKLEELDPELIIPGHGGPTDLATVTRFTKDYLVFMREEVEKVIDDDGGLLDAYNIDQSAYRDWGTYRDLRARNAERIFSRMEFE